MLLQQLLPLFTSLLTFASASPPNGTACYGSTLPSIPPSTDDRSVPWGSPSVHYSSLNGTLTTCCDSLDEIRTALDDIDDKLLDLLNQRSVTLSKLYFYWTLWSMHYYTVFY
jgi:hypothetical protein